MHFQYCPWAIPEIIVFVHHQVKTRVLIKPIWHYWWRHRGTKRAQVRPLHALFSVSVLVMHAHSTRTLRRRSQQIMRQSTWCGPRIAVLLFHQHGISHKNLTSNTSPEPLPVLFNTVLLAQLAQTLSYRLEMSMARWKEIGVRLPNGDAFFDFQRHSLIETTSDQFL
jgi:hypothetical protein